MERGRSDDRAQYTRMVADILADVASANIAVDVVKELEWVKAQLHQPGASHGS